MTKKMECISASLIMAQLLYSENHIGDVFHSVTFAIRASIAFKLHHDHPYHQQWFLSPIKNDLDREIRRRLFWNSYIIDQLYATSTGVIPNNINVNDVYTKLPCHSNIYKNSNFYSKIKENEENFRSLDFFTNHSRSDSFTLLIKSCILLGKVNSWKMKYAYETEDANLESPTMLPEFRV